MRNIINYNRKCTKFIYQTGQTDVIITDADYNELESRINEEVAITQG